MAATFIILSFLIGGLVIIAILLCGNIVFHSWKFYFYIKEKYPAKFDSYKNKFNPFSPTKITAFLDSNDLTLKQITNMLEKRTRVFLYLFSFCVLSIALLTASGLVLHVFHKFD